MVQKVYENEDCQVPEDYQLYEDAEHFSSAIYLKEIQPFGDYHYIADSVLFPPAAYNNWHIYQVEQTLYVTKGRGWYQEEGKPAQLLKAGDVVHIPGGVKHWHGAAIDSWFEHLAIEDVSKGAPTWLERLNLDDYMQLDNI